MGDEADRINDEGQRADWTGEDDWNEDDGLEDCPECGAPGGGEWCPSCGSHENDEED